MNESTPVKANTTSIQQAVAIMPTRLPYHPALAELGCDQPMWRFLCDSLYPSAKSIEGIAMALRYCKARGLDIMKKPVHVVPVYSTAKGGMVELVWPGIGDYRTTASRTQEYAGCDSTDCGPLVEKTFKGEIDKWENNRKVGTKEVEVSLKFHEWMSITVYRIIRNQRVAFHGPKVYFEEIYSRLKHDCSVPNDRWQRAPNGQLEKCAEAAALRKAFPEEIGSEPTAEEMEGKVIDVVPSPVLKPMTTENIKQHVQQHMDQVGTVEKENDAEAFQENNLTESSEDADWISLIDEILPGLHACKGMSDLTKFITENQSHIDNIGNNAPVHIQKRIDDEVGKMVNKIKGKK